MTLDGTNTYVLGAPGSGAAIVVDPGPDDATHRAAVQSVLADLDAACEIILVTHHHADHSEAARAWARWFGCDLVATTPEIAGPEGRIVVEGDELSVGGLHLSAVATPGHCADHVSYRLPTGALLAGDHVLGRGTAVVAWPDGDLAAYLESLRRVLAIGSGTLYPGHGPALDEEPLRVVEYYIEHRLFRERQVLAVLAEGPTTIQALVERIYVSVDRALWPAASLSTRAALEKLTREARVSETSGRYRLLDV